MVAKREFRVHSWFRRKPTTSLTAPGPFGIIGHLQAPVAQLDRVSGYEPEGREFESLRARQLIKHLAALCGFFFFRCAYKCSCAG